MGLPCCREISAPAPPPLMNSTSSRCSHAQGRSYFTGAIFKLASFISFHTTVEAVAGSPGGRLRLKSALLARVIAACFTEVS